MTGPRRAIIREIKLVMLLRGKLRRVRTIYFNKGQQNYPEAPPSSAGQTISVRRDVPLTARDLYTFYLAEAVTGGSE